MSEVDLSAPSTQRRRSERVSQSIPVVVRGVDLLSQPFEERTFTVTFNLHGCRYASRHYLPKNAWVTIERAQGANRYNLRARVAWIQRPHSVREHFQIGVEFEGPSDIWEIETPPADWFLVGRGSHSVLDESYEQHRRTPEENPANIDRTPAVAAFIERLKGAMTNMSAESFASPEDFRETETAVQSPLLHELNSELNRQAQTAVEAATERAKEQIYRVAQEIEQARTVQAEEFFQNWKRAFEQAQEDARENLSDELTQKQERFLARFHSEFENSLQSARELLERIEQKTQTVSTVAAAQEPAERSHDNSKPTEVRNERLESEIRLAQAQWHELLESSLDRSMHLLVEQLSERSQEVLHSTEQKLADRFAEIQQPLAQLFADSRDALTGVKAAVESEVARARNSLAEMEQSAARMKEYAAQLEAASHDTLNQLHKRLEDMVEGQTAEMTERVEKLATEAPENLARELNTLGEVLADRTASDIEARLAPHLERVPALVRELSSREVHIEEGLRLYRERLRQVSENNQREVVAQMADSVFALRNDFDSARADAIAKWNEEVEARGTQTAQSAAETISRASDLVQQDAQARLQVLVEQTLTNAAATMDEKSAEAHQRFAGNLVEQSSAHLATVQQSLDEAADAVIGRSQSHFEAAADAAAASFGQVLRGIADQEAQQFRYVAFNATQESEQKLNQLTADFANNLNAAAAMARDQFADQLATQISTSLEQTRYSLQSELANLFEEFRSRCHAEQRSWTENLAKLGDEVAARKQEQLQATADAWVVSSGHRLNEHGQDVIEGLMRSAEQALRDSCSRVLEGLAEVLRDRPKNAGTNSGPEGEQQGDSPIAGHASAGGPMQ